VLQSCPQKEVDHNLEKLPKDLDETYARMLRKIAQTPSSGDVIRLLQCLSVAFRPLRAGDLAEVLALDFDGPEGAPLELKDHRPLEDRQQDVLTICSRLSLIIFVDNDHSGVIQFSHFTVKEFLTSHPLSTSEEYKNISKFHIEYEPAHTTLAKACLWTLLRLDGASNNDQVYDRFPLARYASEHWVEHAQFEMVSSRIEDGMRRLFDSDQPYFAAWIQLYDIDRSWFYFGDHQAVRRGSPLYYASSCGFRDLAALIISEHPEQVNDWSGRNHSPLAAALLKRHFNVAELLHQHGAAVDLRGGHGRTPLYAASSSKGHVDVLLWLLGHGSDAESLKDDHSTPIIGAAWNGHLEAVQVLLEHGIRINATSKDGCTALFKASECGHVNVMGPLLQYGADIEARDWYSHTPLHLASSRGQLEAAPLLLDNGANIEAKDKRGMTPLLLASNHHEANCEVVRLLLDRGANLNAQDDEGMTPLHRASSMGNAETVRLLLVRGADANAQNEDGQTPLHLASTEWNVEVVRLLLDHGANTEAQNKYESTPLHLASYWMSVNAGRLLLDHGANAEAQDKFGRTPLHRTSRKANVESARLLLDCGADVNARDNDGRTPLHCLDLDFCGGATEYVKEYVRLLLDSGASVGVKDNKGKTPVELIREVGSPVAQMLTEAARCASPSG
jgi:ankyrin repeat protein